jgi:hypothetical protein
LGACFCVWVVSAQFGEPLSINDMLIVFDGRQENLSNSINVVAVTGWSRDGKVAIVQPGSTMYPYWIILDTVTDKIIKEYTSFGAENEYEVLDKLAAEDRLLIITHVSSEHIEFDYTFYTFTYTGCHLTAGF